MKNSATLIFGISWLFACTCLAMAQPANLRNAKVTVQAVSTGGLAGEIERIAASKGPAWIGWAQPVVEGKHRMCCFGSWSRGRRIGLPAHPNDDCCAGCALEKDSSFSIGDDEQRPVPLEGSGGLVVLLRASERRIGRVRALDEDCGLDAGGLPFHWLTGVRPEESIALLGPLARELSAGHRGEDAAGSAMAAIALTGHAAADTALEAMVRAGQPAQLREQAAFWLGNSRGRRGFEVLKRLAAEEPDEDLRKHVTFALSQSKEPQAIGTLIGMAKNDRSSDVRGQALFWLAQEAGEKAAGTIRDAIRDDPDEDVKTKAVFALSQLKNGEGVGELIRVARTNRNPEVRRQAIFWLGQSRDPRALLFIEEILAR